MKTDGWHGLFRGNLVNVIQGHRGTDPNWVPFNSRAMFQCFTMVFFVVLDWFFGLHFAMFICWFTQLIQTLILTLVGQVAYTFFNCVLFVYALQP